MIFNNPLLTKQLREEMRSRKIFFVVPVYIALLSIVALIAVGNSSGVTFNPVALAGTSRVTLYAFVITISILLGLVAIVLGSSSVTTEKEKATFELLELTPLSYADLVLGKFMHGFIVIALILLSSLPVLATLFFMGGLAYIDLFLSLVYLLVFFSIVLLSTICISIVASRTILSIILSLASGFVIAIPMAIITGAVLREPRLLGFAVLSPWLVTWQQIFAPTMMKFGATELPVWLFYLGLYLLIGILLVCWGRNALDSRKLERNPWVRLLALLIINSYIATGVLSMRSFGPLPPATLNAYFETLLSTVVIALPFFTMGIMTDRDQEKFRKKPILESLNISNLFLNHPSTGIFFLMLLTATIAVTLWLCSGWSWSVVSTQAVAPYVWILPWFLIFIAMRLSGFRPRGLFVGYLLGTILFTIMSIFSSHKTPPASLSEFLIGQPPLIVLWIGGVIYFFLAWLLAKKRTNAYA